MPRERVATVICKPCRQAADWVTFVSQFKSDVDHARVLHAKCKGCDCQHKVDLQVEGKSIFR